jgi:hypothetical protein
MMLIPHITRLGTAESSAFGGHALSSLNQILGIDGVVSPFPVDPNHSEKSTRRLGGIVKPGQSPWK